MATRKVQHRKPANCSDAIISPRMNVVGGVKKQRALRLAISDAEMDET
ncbi:hypothetical protein [Paraburkholderia piptadeniae]|nr:hypothetical protein [Paraburkholderia piptadeniae]